MTGPTLLKFPAPDVVNAREALQKALDEQEPLTNVIVLSQRENGRIYHTESSGLTLAEVNWIIDGYKWWLQGKANAHEP